MREVQEQQASMHSSLQVSSPLSLSWFCVLTSPVDESSRDWRRTRQISLDPLGVQTSALNRESEEQVVNLREGQGVHDAMMDYKMFNLS